MKDFFLYCFAAALGILIYKYTTEESYYITYDPEGDYLLWNEEPVFHDGIWIPQTEDFNCVQIDSNAVLLLTDELPNDNFVKILITK